MEKLPRMSFLYRHLSESLFHRSFLFHVCIFFINCSFGVVMWVCGVLGFFSTVCPNELQGPELTSLLFLYLWWQDQLKLHLLTSQEPAWLLLVTEPAPESTLTWSQLLLMSWEAGRWVASEVTWCTFCWPCMAFQGLPAAQGSPSGSWSGSVISLWLWYLFWVKYSAVRICLKRQINNKG